MGQIVILLFLLEYILWDWVVIIEALHAFFLIVLVDVTAALVVGVPT